MDRTSRQNPDYYGVLGVLSTATPEEIEAAFRELARRWHPDVCSDVECAAENFKRAAEAHEVLRDPEKRRRYDRGRAGSRSEASRTPRRYAKQAQPPAGISPTSRSADPASDLFELIRALFGASIGPQTAVPKARRGNPLEVELAVSPEEAIRGGAVPITLRLPGRCQTCGGSGRVEKTLCDRCAGRGSVRGECRNIVVRVPPGVRTGSRLHSIVEDMSRSGAAEEVVFRIRISPYV